jgi:uncharacterized membrane protein
MFLQKINLTAVKYSKFALVAILLIGISLRIYKLDAQSLWLDELSSMIGSAPWNSFEVIVDYSRKDQPPLFFLLLHYWMNLFGYNEIAARLLVSIVGVLGIYSIFFLGKEIGNRNTGLIASFLTSINYFHLFFSQDVRFYSLVFLLTTLSFLFFIRALGDEKVINVILYAFFSSCLFYTHYFSLVVYGTQIVTLIFIIAFYKGFEKGLIKAISLASFLSLIFNIWWIPQYLSDIKTDNFWIGELSPWFLIRYFIQYFKEPITILVFVAVSYLFFKQIAKDFFRNGFSIKTEYFTLVSWIVFSYLIPLIYSVVWEPMLLPRYTMISLPGLLIFISLGFQHLPTSRLKVQLIGLIGVSFVVFLFAIDRYYNRPNKAQWREVSRQVLCDSTKNYAYFSSYDFYFNSYFYQLSKSTSQRCLHPETVDFNEIIKKSKGIWLLEAHNEGSKIAKDKLELIELNFKKEKEKVFFNAKATLYVK